MGARCSPSEWLTIRGDSSIGSSSSRHGSRRRSRLRFADRALTFAQFRTSILGAAGRLHELGLGTGDRVVLAIANSLEFPVAYFAIHATGAVAVPLAPETPDSMLAALARDCAAKVAIVERSPAGMPCRVEPIARLGTGEAREVYPWGHTTDVADILYTTGTTGNKKAVVLTHDAIKSAAVNMTEFIGTTAEDVEVVPLPLYHSFGLGRLRCLALVGHTLILVPGVRTGILLMQTLAESRATGLAIVPAGIEILRRLGSSVLGRATRNLRYVEIGSAPMRQETRAWLMDMLPTTRICHHYGLTEASRAAFTEYHSDQSKATSAGRSSPNVRITICDGAFRPLGPRQVGEVVVRGRMVMREYWRQPERTREAFCAHGLRTGDLGYLDEDGYLFLLGRESDIINVGGRKVAPDEVEEALATMDGVHDVACVGDPDPVIGQQLKAYIVADRPIDRTMVAGFLRPRLEEFKIPRSVELVSALPRSNSGKLQRCQLRLVAAPNRKVETHGSRSVKAKAA